MIILEVLVKSDYYLLIISLTFDDR